MARRVEIETPIGVLLTLLRAGALIVTSNGNSRLECSMDRRVFLQALSGGGGLRGFSGGKVAGRAVYADGGESSAGGDGVGNGCLWACEDRDVGCFDGYADEGACAG